MENDDPDILLHFISRKCIVQEFSDACQQGCWLNCLVAITSSLVSYSHEFGCASEVLSGCLHCSESFLHLCQQPFNWFLNNFALEVAFGVLLHIYKCWI